MSAREAHRAADISLYRTSISHLGVDFSSFFFRTVREHFPFRSTRFVRGHRVSPRCLRTGSTRITIPPPVVVVKTFNAPSIVRTNVRVATDEYQRPDRSILRAGDGKIIQDSSREVIFKTRTTPRVALN